MFKLALILEMVGAPDNDSIQNLFLDNTFLVDLLFSAKNLELLCEFSRTLISLKAVERGTTNYTKVSEALKKMKFCDFLLHCVALNINDADQGQVQKKVQLMQNCWRLVDRGTFCTASLYFSNILSRGDFSSCKRFSRAIAQIKSSAVVDSRFSTRRKGSVY